MYRSAYKNARRLAATESNIAYRTADYERWQQLDFVVGIRVVLSNNHTLNGEPFYDICDRLSAPMGSKATKGRGCYPKTFKFTGWHPLCRCHTETILKTLDEMRADEARILAGEPVSNQSENSVYDVPQEFKDWIKENEERIERAKSLPYFIRDNDYKYWGKPIVVSRFDEDYFDRLVERGIRFYATSEKIMQSNPFNRMDIVWLNDQIQTIFAKHGINGLTCVVDAYSNGIAFRWSGGGVTLVRSFSVKNGVKVVDHDLFVLPKELQNKGLSKPLFKVLYEQYKIVGVQRMEVYANMDVGGYTWARYGFCAEERKTVDKAIQFRKLTTEQKEEIKTIVKSHFKSSSEPFPMNKIAKLPYGKKALLGGSWKGVIDLTNASQRNVFENYLGR